jgi:predicted nucleotidyltransferase
MSNIQGLDLYSYEEIVSLVRDFINDKLEDNGYFSDDIIVKDIKLYGSRLRAQARDGSDLDVVIQYEGDIREDDFFDMLNDEHLYIDNVVVDINPIKEDMGDYMNRSDQYDNKKLGLKSNRLESLEKRLVRLEEKYGTNLQPTNEVAPTIVAKLIPIIIKYLPLFLESLPALIKSFKSKKTNSNGEKIDDDVIKKLDDSSIKKFVEIGTDLMKVLSPDNSKEA